MIKIFLSLWRRRTSLWIYCPSIQRLFAFQSCTSLLEKLWEIQEKQKWRRKHRYQTDYYFFKGWAPGWSQGEWGASSGKKRVCNKWRKIAPGNIFTPLGPLGNQGPGLRALLAAHTMTFSTHVCCCGESLYVISTLHQGEFRPFKPPETSTTQPLNKPMACFLFLFPDWNHFPVWLCF